MKRTYSKRQLRYAYGLINEDKTKQQIALDAGFSYSTSRVPQSIENKKGFKLAMGYLAGEAGNVAMKLMFELQARDMDKMDTETLLSALGAATKAYSVFSPKTQ